MLNCSNMLYFLVMYGSGSKENNIQGLRAVTMIDTHPGGVWKKNSNF